MLVISYYLEAENNCEYTQQEFISGMTRLDCDSISNLKSKLPVLRKQLQETSKFQVHSLCFLDIPTTPYGRDKTKV